MPRWLVALGALLAPVFVHLDARADTPIDVFDSTATSGSACGPSLGPRFTVDATGDGQADTLVVVRQITGGSSVVTFGGDKQLFFAGTGGTCPQGDNTARLIVRFVDMTAPGFDASNEASWTYRALPGVRADGLTDGSTPSPPLLFNLFAYRQINQTDRVDPLFGTPTGAGTKVFSDATGIRELATSGNASEQDIDNLILMATTPNTLVGSNVTAVLSNGSVRFPTVTVPGNTRIVTQATGDPAPPAANPPCMPGTGSMYYVLDSNATVTGTATVCVTLAPWCQIAGVRFSTYRTVCGLSSCTSSWADTTTSTSATQVCGTISYTSAPSSGTTEVGISDSDPFIVTRPLGTGVCGDGMLNGNETCDQGAANGSPSSCCSGSCTLRAAGSVCRAATSSCDAAETCSGDVPVCPADVVAPLGTACNDGNACTLSDQCNGSGVCTGTQRNCDDGLFCNGVETCAPATGCVAGTPPAISDGVACTTDACNETTDTITHTPNNAACNDGLFCNGTETCGANGCAAGTPPAISDGVACTTDSCDEATDRVVHTPNNAACSDGLFCNGTETCGANGCAAGTPPAISDGVACTTDACNEATDTITHTPNNAACNDGLFCNGTETCGANGCVVGTAPPTSDGVACTTDACNEATDTISHTPNDAACDDSLFCNGTETCGANGCAAGTPPAISDGVACTTDTCDEAADKVVHVPNDVACSDGVFCNGAETCDPASGCRNGPVPVVTDGVQCTDDSCDEAKDEIVHTPNDARCDDGLWCNGSEKCDRVRDCLPGAHPDLDDGIACTDDSCDEASHILVHTPNDGVCDNGRACDGAEQCDPSKKGCLPGGKADCGGKDTGGTCRADADCLGGHCVDDVCCESTCEGPCVACSAKLTGGLDGSCAPAAAGTDPKSDCKSEVESTCGMDGTCDGAGACRYYAEGTTCSSDLCQLPNVANMPDTCDGQGHCLEHGAVRCKDGFACVGFACKETCDGDADCVATHYCVDGKCVEDSPRGAPCTDGGHCKSNQCVDGVCCDTACAGECRACTAALKGYGTDGVCEPIAADADPADECSPDGSRCGALGTCDGSGACRRFAPPSTPCGDTTCAAAVVSGKLCSGSAECITASAPCGSYQCGGDACATECKADSACAATAFCTAAGTCAERLPPGSSCGGDSQCESGFCADGFCCESRCDGQCEACDSDGGRGKCVPVAGDPHGERAPCAGGHTVCAGSCNGDDRAACEYPDALVSCAAAACRNGVLSAQVCNGAGACTLGDAQECAPFACDEGACKTTCTQDSDCVSGSACRDGKCGALTTNVRCIDESTLMAESGDTERCFPLRCRDGACLEKCTNDDECAVGRHCKAGECLEETILPKAKGEDDGGCGCRIAGRSDRGPSTWLAASGLALALARRRRRSVRA